ncbi:hypothetical protein VTO42DRAFT_9049 [Malbranchea cinnamomea]
MITIPGSKSDRHLTSRHSDGALRKPPGHTTGTDASPVMAGRRHPKHSLGANARSCNRLPMTRTPAASIWKRPLEVRSESVASFGGSTPGTNRLAASTVRDTDTPLFSKRLRRPGASPKTAHPRKTPNTSPGNQGKTQVPVNVPKALPPEKPLPRPPVPARDRQETFIEPRDIIENQFSLDCPLSSRPGASKTRLTVSPAKPWERGTDQLSAGEEGETPTTLEVREEGKFSAPSANVINCGNNRSIAVLNSSSGFAPHTATASALKNSFKRSQGSALFVDNKSQMNASAGKSPTENPSMSDQLESPIEDSDMDHSKVDESSTVTPTKQDSIPVKPNPFRDRLQASMSPHATRQTSQSSDTGALNYDFDEVFSCQSPAPASVRSKKAALLAQSLTSKPSGNLENVRGLSKRKSRIPRISSPTVSASSPTNDGSNEGRPKLQAFTPGNKTSIPYPSRLLHKKCDGLHTRSRAVDESKDAENQKPSFLESEGAEETGEVELCEARVATAIEIPKGNDGPNNDEPITSDNVKVLPGGVKLKQLSVAGRSNGPTLRISPDAERVIMGTGGEDSQDIRSGRRSGTRKDFRLSTDSFIGNLTSKRKTRSPTDIAARSPKREETRTETKTLPGAKSTESAIGSPPHIRRTKSKQSTAKNVAGTPTKNPTNPFRQGSEISVSLYFNSPGKKFNEHGHTRHGNNRNEQDSIKAMEDGRPNDSFGAKSPIKYNNSRSTTPFERADLGNPPSPFRREEVQHAVASHVSRRARRRQSNEHIVPHRMKTNGENASVGQLAHEPIPGLETVRNPTHNMLPQKQRPSAARESKLLAVTAKPKFPTRGVFQNFRGLFAKNKDHLKGTSKVPAAGAITSSEYNSHSNGAIASRNSIRLDQSRSQVFHSDQISDDLPARTLRPVYSVSQLAESPAMRDTNNISSLTMELLEAARLEQETSKKEKLIRIGKILIKAVNYAHDAEKAMLTAMQAAKEAEISCAMAKENAFRLSQVVREWAENELDSFSK